MAIEKSIEKEVVDYLRETPKAMAVVVVAFLSGHLWVFVITAFIRSRTKGNKMVQSVIGRTAIGIVWLTGILVPLYCMKYGDFGFEYDRILQVAIPTTVTGLFIQLFLFIIFITVGDRK
ncbi:MAG: hypothetical protein HGB23_11365 [Chlorobiaceae bacterium]|nr:hypothetical protein [Chlorobiaceae bacterium]